MIRTLSLALVIAASLTVRSYGHSREAAADSVDTEAAVAAAREWVGLLDEGDISESWSEASAVFRGAVTNEDWTAAVTRARAPYLPLGERTLASAQYSTTVPGAPPGEYVLIQFRTRAAEGAVVETAVMMLDSGEWRTAGYFIRPADL